MAGKSGEIGMAKFNEPFKKLIVVTLEMGMCCEHEVSDFRKFIDYVRKFPGFDSTANLLESSLNKQLSEKP